MSYTQVSYYMKSDLRWLSDHALLIVDLHITPENICVYKIVFKHDSEEEVVFLLSVSEGLSQLDFYTLDSVASLNSLSKAISKLFSNYWATYVKRIMVTT